MTTSEMTLSYMEVKYLSYSLVVMVVLLIARGMLPLDHGTRDLGLFDGGETVVALVVLEDVKFGRDSIAIGIGGLVLLDGGSDWGHDDVIVLWVGLEFFPLKDNLLNLSHFIPWR